MTPSASIIAFIKGYEKFRPAAYYATVNEKANGIVTIGYGHTQGVKIGDVWDMTKATAVFTSDIDDFSKGVTALIGNAPTNQNQYDALVSLSFNIGLTGFKTSSVLTNHKAGHYQTAQWAFSLWNKQHDAKGNLVVVDGLTRRRAAEALIYGTPA